MKASKLITIILCIISCGNILIAQVPVKPAHVVIVLEENYAQSEIIGSAYAPTLTALAASSTTINFTQAFAITHPSEPNYLDLFSGSNQGTTGDVDGPASNAPFNNCNLGSSLISKGYTFIGYSESLPSAGWYLSDNGNYYTKHCPWINWMHGTSDTIPVSSDLPFSSFPDSNHYSTLPTVSWVTPNIVDDMHNPSTPSIAISNGDAWFNSNIMPLVRWAANPANNTLVIVTWDEDDGNYNNNIPLLFCSGLVKGGNSTTNVTHYDVLKTIEDMYGLSLCGSSATASDVPSTLWNITAINSITEESKEVKVWPIPAKEQLNIKIANAPITNVELSIYDITGRVLKKVSADLNTDNNYFTISTEGVSDGVYFLNITGENINVCKKISIAR